MCPRRPSWYKRGGRAGGRRGRAAAGRAVAAARRRVAAAAAALPGTYSLRDSALSVSPHAVSLDCIHTYTHTQ